MSLFLSGNDAPRTEPSLRDDDGLRDAYQASNRTSPQQQTGGDHTTRLTNHGRGRHRNQGTPAHADRFEFPNFASLFGFNATTEEPAQGVPSSTVPSPPLVDGDPATTPLTRASIIEIGAERANDTIDDDTGNIIVEKATDAVLFVADSLADIGVEIGAATEEAVEIVASNLPNAPNLDAAREALRRVVAAAEERHRAVVRDAVVKDVLLPVALVTAVIVVLALEE